MSVPTDEEFRECFLELGLYGVPTLIGWYCRQCGALVPHITDTPPDQPEPREVHHAHHALNDRT